MKIALGIRYFMQVGGAERITRSLVGHLVSQGHAVRVYAVRGIGMPGVDMRLVPVPAMMPRFMRDWLTGRAIAKALANDDSAVTFGEQKIWNCQVLRPGGGVEDEYWKSHHRYARWSRLAPQWMRRVHLKRWFDLKAERAGYAASTLQRVIANSTMIKDQLLLNYPHLAGRVVVIQNGVDLEEYSPEHHAQWRHEIRAQYGVNEDDVLLLFMGHDFRRKGLDTTLRALALARDLAPEAPFRLLVAGRASIRYYQLLITRLRLRDRVIVAGRVDRPEAYYAASDALVLPSFYDPFANVTIEAMGASLPVITSAQNGASELIAHGRNGWVIPDAQSADALAACYLELLDTDRLARARQSALETARRHTMTETLSRVEEVLLETGQGVREPAGLAS